MWENVELMMDKLIMCRRDFSMKGPASLRLKGSIVSVPQFLLYLSLLSISLTFCTVIGLSLKGGGLICLFSRESDSLFIGSIVGEGFVIAFRSLTFFTKNLLKLLAIIVGFCSVTPLILIDDGDRFFVIPRISLVIFQAS